MLRDRPPSITFSLNHLGPMLSFTCEQKEFLSAAVEITVNLDFWCSYKSKNDGGILFPRLPFRNSCKACYEVVWSRSWFCLIREEAILTNGCCSEWLHSLLVACDLYSLCRMIRLQLSIGEWLRGHGETILVFFRSWSRYFSLCLFMCFSINFQTNSCGFFICLFFSLWNCIFQYF